MSNTASDPLIPGRVYSVSTYYYGNDQYRVWFQDGVWHWKLVGRHWEIKQEHGQISIVEGHGLGDWNDACEEAKRVLSDFRFSG
jgi:hypothetical protein